MKHQKGYSEIILVVIILLVVTAVISTVSFFYANRNNLDELYLQRNTIEQEPVLVPQDTNSEEISIGNPEWERAIFPANSLCGTSTLKVDHLGSVGTPPEGYYMPGYKAFTVTSQDFSGPDCIDHIVDNFTVEFVYSDGVDGLSAENVSIVYFDRENNEFNWLATNIDSERSVVTTNEASNFGAYAVVHKAECTGLPLFEGELQPNDIPVDGLVFMPYNFVWSLPENAVATEYNEQFLGKFIEYTVEIDGTRYGVGNFMDKVTPPDCYPNDPLCSSKTSSTVEYSWTNYSEVTPSFYVVRIPSGIEWFFVKDFPAAEFQNIESSPDADMMLRNIQVTGLERTLNDNDLLSWKNYIENSEIKFVCK